MSDRIPLLSSFLLSLLSRYPRRPFILGISGPQGAGKTTTVSTFAEHLRSEHNLSVAVLSVDDLYLTHSDQLALAQRHPENLLLSHRGEPGTHDISLGVETFAALRRNQDVIKFPVYDKSHFNGQGDRLPPEEWPSVASPVDVLLFEGWCVGFRAIGKDAVARLRERRKALSRHTLQSLLEVDTYLQSYDVLTDQLDALVHIDAEDIDYVYGWRLQQEHELKMKKGSGMNDDAVRRFVDAYMPGYELYIEALRNGVHKEEGRQLRMVIGKDRKVVLTQTL